MVLVVGKKSRTFSSLPCSAHEQLGRSWARAQPGSKTQLASGNIPYHGRHAQFMSGGWLGGRNSLLILFFESLVWEFKSSLVQEFGLFQEFHKIREIREFWVP